MNSVASRKTFGLTAAAVLIWLALLLPFFLPSEAIPKFVLHPREVLNGSTATVLIYTVGSLVFILKTIVLGEDLTPQFLHSQSLVTLFPVTFLATGLAFLFFARLSLGHFPMPNHPDPDTLGLSLPLFHITWIASLPVLMAAYILLQYRGKITWAGRRARIIGLLCCAGIWIAFYLVMKNDPLYFFDWLGD